MTDSWPQSMKRRTASLYCDISEAAFEREVAAGRLPQPIKLGGREHWHRPSLDAALAQIAGQADDEPDYMRKHRERYGQAVGY